jgi:hypothetical protein
MEILLSDRIMDGGRQGAHFLCLGVIFGQKRSWLPVFEGDQEQYGPKMTPCPHLLWP